MLKTIFLGPGRFFCGEAVDDGSRHRRYRLSAFRQRGPVLVVSIAFWLILMAGGVVLCATLGTNVDPPPKKPPANLKAPRPWSLSQP